jgi:hypothetical protein
MAGVGYMPNDDPSSGGQQDCAANMQLLRIAPNSKVLLDS